MICIFCFRSDSNPIPWCVDNPGRGCQYGLAHEYHPSPEDAVVLKTVEKKPAKNLCVKCGLHPRNPVSAQNGCAHEYPV